MKSFAQLREAKKEPKGDKVFSKKVGKVKVTVYQEGKGFCAYIDGDKLDTYRSQKEAERMAVEFAKEI